MRRQQLIIEAGMWWISAFEELGGLVLGLCVCIVVLCVLWEVLYLKTAWKVDFAILLAQMHPQLPFLAYMCIYDVSDRVGS